MVHSFKFKRQINVKILLFTAFSVFFFQLTACFSQSAKNITVIKIASGNTGFKGRAMPEDMNKTNEGIEFIDITMKAQKKCRIDSAFYVFKQNSQRIRMESQMLPKLLKKNEEWTWRIENNALTNSLTSDESKKKSTTIEFFLKGKKEIAVVKSIERILPK